MFLLNDSLKVAKIRHAFVKLHRIVFTKVSLCLQINGKQNTTFQFSVELISNKMHEATLKLVITQSNMFIAHTELLLQIIGEFLNVEKHFHQVKNALSEGFIKFILNFVVITLRLYSRFERKP